MNSVTAGPSAGGEDPDGVDGHMVVMASHSAHPRALAMIFSLTAPTSSRFQPERPYYLREPSYGASGYYCGQSSEEVDGMAGGRTLRKRSRAVMAALALASGLALLPASPAAAHVHGITPLRCVGTADDGANQTDTTPASAANGGPISGLIPRDVGNAPLTVGDGGFDTPACPASP